MNYLNETSGTCHGGYYCSGSAAVPNPTDGNVTGDICPMGAYCPPGTVVPNLCPQGTYLNSTGNDLVSDCIQCTGGYYCAGSGNVVPDGPCEAGWYCPGGQDDPRPTGYNCTQGR